MSSPVDASLIRWLLPAIGALGAVAAIGAATGADRLVTSYAEGSATATAASLAPGLGLVAAGTYAVWDRTFSAVGQVTLAAGLAWLAPLWIGWITGPELVRSVGMIVAPFILPALLHLVITYPSGRTSSAWSRLAVGTAWFSTAGMSVVRATVRDPFLDPYCWSNCTDNVFLVHPNPGLARGLDEFWLRVVLAAGVVALGIAGWRLARASRAGRSALWVIAVPAAVAAAGEAAYAPALLHDPAEDPTKVVFRTVYDVRAVALFCLAIGLTWAVLRGRRRRATVARLAEDLGEAPPPGSLQTALARTLGDASLRVLYWLPRSQHYVDAEGQVATPQSGRGRAATPVVRGGRPVALVQHDLAGYEAAELEEHIGSAARLAIDNERLAAEVQARTEDLRSSRARIVEAADTARRQLERDLHDGAQQRLLAVTYELRLARAATTDPQLAKVLDKALTEARTALAELRELANGIFPAVLNEAGLESALWTLAEQAALPVELTAVPLGRLPAAVERAAYLVVAGTVEVATSELSVAVTRQTDTLVIEVHGAFGALPDHLADRVGAIGGVLVSQADSFRAEIPCGRQGSAERRSNANHRG